MSWELSGRSLELCSCNALCPCWLGPEGKPDQEWCSAVFGFDIEAGNSEGVDLTGVKAVLMAHWPENFFSGNGSARLFLDESAGEDQKREAEGGDGAGEHIGSPHVWVRPIRPRKGSPFSKGSPRGVAVGTLPHRSEIGPRVR